MCTAVYSNIIYNSTKVNSGKMLCKLWKGGGGHVNKAEYLLPSQEKRQTWKIRRGIMLRGKRTRSFAYLFCRQMMTILSRQLV